MEPARPFRLAALLAVVAFVCFYGAFVVQGILHTVAPSVAPPVLALAPLGYILFTRRIAKTDGLGERATPVTTLVTAVGAPVFAAHAHVALALPIVKLHEGRDQAFIDAALLLVTIVAGAIVLTDLGARALLRREIAAIAAPVRVAALAALALVSALVIASFASPRPAPGRWIASLPVVALISEPSALDAEEQTEVGDLVIDRRCERNNCGAWMHRRGEQASRAPFLDATGLLELRRDAAHDLWILDGGGGREHAFIDRVTDRIACGGPFVARTEVRPRTLAGALSPPRGWIVAAAIGVVLALRRLARRRGVQRRLDEILAAEAGTLDEEGFITLDRGLARLRASTRVAPGPVLVVLPAGAGPAYRSEGARSADRVLAGTRDGLAEAARREMTTLDASALAALLIAAAPLFVAWIEGLR
jgi:hypothetical protein